MKHSLVRHNQLFTLFLVSKKRASNKNEIVIDVQTVYEINHISQFKSLGDKILCVLYLYCNVAFHINDMEIPETKRFIPKGFELGTTLS